MIERGIVIAGKILPGTERVLRDSSAWWELGDKGTRERAGLIDLYACHWTAGRIGRTGPKVVGAMKARATSPTNPKECSIHFVVQWDGQIWQAADPALTATVHIGWRPVYRRSIGVEHTWPGTLRQAAKLGQLDVAEHDHVRACGFEIDILRPSQALLDASVWLAERLAGLEGEAGIFIPRQVPSELGRRLTRSEALTWSGAIEHMSVPTTKKLDCAGRLLGALAEAGWRVAPP